MTLQEQIRANRFRTVWLVLLFLLLFGAIGGVLALAYDVSLLIVVGVIAILYGIFSYFAAGRMIAVATGARPASREEYPRVLHVLETVAIGAGLERVPPLYVVDDPAPNAFAAGRKPENAYVAVTTGLVQLMDERRLEGVLAHEIAHVRNRDVRLMSLVAVLVGVIAILSDILLRLTIWGGRRAGRNPVMAAIAIAALVIAPIAAFLIQLCLSRRREYLADASAAEITGDAEGMALALRTLLEDTQETRHAASAVAHLYIESPLRQGNRAFMGTFASLFATHPPLPRRIAALEEAGGFRLP